MTLFLSLILSINIQIYSMTVAYLYKHCQIDGQSGYLLFATIAVILQEASLITSLYAHSTPLQLRKRFPKMELLVQNVYFTFFY